jgi:hypothetical protein
MVLLMLEKKHSAGLLDIIAVKEAQINQLLDLLKRACELAGKS